MHLTIELPYDLETQLREQAHQKGKALNQYITGLIQEKFTEPRPKTSSLTAEETRLFQIINKGFSDEFWTKLRHLYTKRGKIPKKVCFYFFEKLQIFQKNKNKPLSPSLRVQLSNRRKSGILPRFVYR